MATRKTVDKIQIKRGAGAALTDTQKSAVLAEGEPFYHKGEGKVFIGNGSNTVNNLPYVRCTDKIVALGDSKTSVSTVGVAVGTNCTSQDGGIAVGGNVRVGGSNSVAIGNGVSSNGSNGITIGTNSKSFENGAIVIGNDVISTSIQGENSVLVGHNYTFIGNNAVVIGNGINQYSTQYGCHDAVVLGNSTAINNDGYIYGLVSIGNSNKVEGSFSTVIGTNSISYGNNSVVLGVNSSSGWTDASTGKFSPGNNAVVIGTNSYASDNAIAIGRDSIVKQDGAIKVSSGKDSCWIELIPITDGITRVQVSPTVVIVGSNAVASNGCIAIGKDANAGGSGSSGNGRIVQICSNSLSINDGEAYIGNRQISLASTSSDRRLKQNVETANTAMCLNDVCSIPLYKYEYKPFVKETKDKHLVGWMADDVEKVFKHAVFEDDRTFTECDDNGNDIIDSETGELKQFTIEKVKSINMQRVGLPTLWGAVQELSKLMTATQERVAELETAVKTLKKENTLLKKQLKELETSTKDEPSIEE